MSDSPKIKTDLSKFDNAWYSTGAGKVKWALWYLTNAFILLNPYNPFGSLKKFALRLFGAKIGKGVVIKQRVNVKFAWNLEVGDHVWIGEGVWIENLAKVTIADHCCISQGAMLLTGNHNYKKSTFDLMVEEIKLESGAWIGAKAVVSPGVTCGSHSVLTVNSVAVKDLEPYTIYAGNPCQKVRNRNIES